MSQPTPPPLQTPPLPLLIHPWVQLLDFPPEVCVSMSGQLTASVAAPKSRMHQMHNAKALPFHTHTVTRGRNTCTHRGWHDSLKPGWSARR